MFHYHRRSHANFYMHWSHLRRVIITIVVIGVLDPYYHILMFTLILLVSCSFIVVRSCLRQSGIQLALSGLCHEVKE